MTDQADALAGKAREFLKDEDGRLGDTYQIMAAFAAQETAHFAEEIAKVRAELHATCQSLGCQNRARLYDQERDANTIATLTAENERLKNVDCTPLCEPGQHTSACFKTIRAENERLKGAHNLLVTTCAETYEKLVNTREALRIETEDADKAEATLERVREGMTRAPVWIYDTHGWFFCAWCNATTAKRTVSYLDPRPGHAMGHIEPENPDAHKPYCPYLALALLAPEGNP